MKTLVFQIVLLFHTILESNSQEYLSVSGHNLTLNGEKVFLSGMNQAWHNYGADFGLNFYSKSRPTLIKTLDDIQKSGGNSIRIWIHISGVYTPKFNSSGYVTGLDPNITRDMTDFVKQAQQRNILVTFTLWNCAVYDKTLPLFGLINDEKKLQSYITNALPQMVRALKSQKGLGMWEIINEPEGCVQPETKDKEPCYDTSTLHFWDFSDWTYGEVPLQKLLRFIALQAHVIHKEDPKALVTVGSWTYKSVTNQLNRRDFYSDYCLSKASEGLSGSRLDLYQIHTYDTLFFYLPHDPFEWTIKRDYKNKYLATGDWSQSTTRPAVCKSSVNGRSNCRTSIVDGSIYKLDKPVIIGEFSQKKGGFMTSEEQFLWAYEHGYNGAWSWCANDNDDASDDIATQMRGISTLKNKNDQSKGGRININIRGENSFIYFLYYIVLEFFSMFLNFFPFVFD